MDLDDFRQAVKDEAKKINVLPSTMELEFLANVYIGAMYIYLYHDRLPETISHVDTIVRIGAIVSSNRKSLPEEYHKIIPAKDGVPTRYYLANMDARSKAYTVADNKDLKVKLNNILKSWGQIP